MALYLNPLPYAVGVIPAMCNHQAPVSLRIPEVTSTWTGKDIPIEDIGTGAPMFHVSGKATSWSSRKHFTDAQGTPLLELTQEHMHLVHKTFNAHAPGGQGAPLFTARRKSAWSKERLEVTYMNATTGQSEVLAVSGSWTNRNAEIRLGNVNGPVVAAIARENVGIARSMTGHRSFVLHVAPGGDLAMMAALCICLNELMRQAEANMSAAILASS